MLREEQMHISFNIQLNKIESENILELLYINVPTKFFWNYILLNNRYHDTNYGRHEPISNMVYINEVYSHILYNFVPMYRYSFLFKRMLHTSD